MRSAKHMLDPGVLAYIIGLSRKLHYDKYKHPIAFILHLEDSKIQRFQETRD